MNDTPGRKPISKSKRFEVFKRDSFKCQYCGAVAPDVLLQVDHIRPVADGGTNELTNLITSCEPCNNGKSNTLLSDNSAVSKARNQMEVLQERREQLELMMEWQRGLRDLDGNKVDQVADFWRECLKGRYHLNENGLHTLRKWLRKYSVQEITTAMGAAVDSYCCLNKDGHITHESVNDAWSKVSGICSVNRGLVSEPHLKDLLYIRAIVRNRLEGKHYIHHLALQWLKAAHSWGATLDELRNTALDSWTWNQFSAAISEVIDEAKRRKGAD